MPSPWVPSGGGGGGVTAVTGTSPISSSGGDTPDISISSAAFAFPPIQNTFWVGKEPSTGAQIGSIRDQFILLSDAVAAAAALPVGSTVTYLLADKSYAGDIVGNFKSGLKHNVISLCGGSLIDSVINVPCSGNLTELSLTDITASAGIGLTGSGNATIELKGSAPGNCTVFTVDDTLMVSGVVSVKAINTNYTVAISAGFITRVENYECNFGASIMPAAQYSQVGGNLLGPISYFQLVDRGIVDCVIYDHIVCGAASAGFLAGFQTCLWNGSLAPQQFTGPVGSFTTDIESAYSFFFASGSLIGGATSNFTDAGFEGYVLQIVGGLPTFTNAVQSNVQIPVTGANQTFDFTASSNYSSDWSSNLTASLVFPTSNTPCKVVIEVTGVGGWSFAISTPVLWAGGIAPTFDNTTGAINTLTFIPYTDIGGTRRWLGQWAPGYA